MAAYAAQRTTAKRPPEADEVCIGRAARVRRQQHGGSDGEQERKHRGAVASAVRRTRPSADGIIPVTVTTIIRSPFVVRRTAGVSSSRSRWPACRRCSAPGRPPSRRSPIAARRATRPSTRRPPTSWRWSRRSTSSSRISRVSKDNVLFCMHDDTLERTTNVAEVFPDRVVDRMSDAAAGQALAGQRLHDGRDQAPRRRASGSSRSSPAQRIQTFQEAIDLVRRQGRHLSRAEVAAAAASRAASIRSSCSSTSSGRTASRSPNR